ncbi:MAG: glycosyltransferase family 2 protein [Kiritimatiellia bacterium]|jgi:glycosyltransferase involved in cell wall biosynthesis
MTPSASVIVPCWNSSACLGACLDSLRDGTCADFEIIAVDDGSDDDTFEVLSRAAASDPRIRPFRRPHGGVSAARNFGLGQAVGRVVFFVDPDDTVAPDFLAKPLARLDATGADFVIFAYAARRDGERDFTPRPLRAAYDFASNAEIRAHFLPRVFGYSLDRVREWNRGAPLFGRRELGSVCRCAFRRDFLRRADIRFDETLVLNEDAMFLSEAALAAASMASLDEPLYFYAIHATGAMISVDRDRRMFGNKLRLLRKRRELDRREGGALEAAYAGSCVFSLMELLHLTRVIDIPFAESHRVVADYASDPVVRRALSRFPLSVRHPVAALLVILLRLRLARPLHAFLHVVFLPARRSGRRARRYAGIR